MNTVDAFLDAFKLAAALYDNRLLQLNIRDDPDRYKPAREIVAAHLCGFRLSQELLTRAIERYQKSTYQEQELLLIALRTDFEKTEEQSIT